MKQKELTKIGRFLTFVLRHKPEEIDLELDSNGWAFIDDIIQLSTKQDYSLTREIIESVVEADSKGRFALSDDGNKIRAQQGHSTNVVSIEYKSDVPPDVLYHGTAQHKIDSILKLGLIKGKRHHVHLTTDFDTALQVGARYGSPVVIEIDAKRMVDDGFVFFLSENKVWLIEHVQAQYIKTKSVS